MQLEDDKAAGVLLRLVPYCLVAKYSLLAQEHLEDDKAATILLLPPLPVYGCAHTLVR